MTNVAQLFEGRSTMESHQLDFLAETEVVFHCHHFNLFFDQTIDDALGTERGTQLRTEAGHKSAYHLLRGLFRDGRYRTPIERLDAATTLLRAMGHGRLDSMTNRSGGNATGDYLHYGFGWREKYGKVINRTHCADGFAAGFLAAANELAYDLDIGSLAATESGCIATGERQCTFDVVPRTQRIHPSNVHPSTAEATLPASFDGEFADRIQEITAGVRGFLSGVQGDDRGVIDAFGVLVTMHLADYYNHLANDTLRVVATEKPHAQEAFRALLVESGQVCSFHTFGGVLASPEWDAMVGAPSGEPSEILIGSLALARAFGFGRWSLEDWIPEERLVLSSPGTYESLFSRLAPMSPHRAPNGILLGAALGIMALAHRVDWANKQMLDQALYRDIAMNSPWKAEQTHSIVSGDDRDRVVVSPR